MRAEKGEGEIKCIDDWQVLAGPKSRDQWVEGRSAYELARSWCETGSVAMPPELRSLLDSHEMTRELAVECVYPEHRIPFDKLGGEPRNADLAFVGTARHAKVAVTVEAKADEPFGATVGETIAAALERLVESPNSKGVQRVEGLVKALFVARAEKQTRLCDLRYQLLTASAGTLAYAIEQGASLAVLIVHEFVTSKTQDGRHAQNGTDYVSFLDRLRGESPLEDLKSGLVGPFKVPGAPLFANAPPLLVGKVTTQRRETPPR